MKMKEFTPQFFIHNRKALLDKTDTDLIVISANSELQRSGDTAFPFRQDSNFWYLTGIDEAEFILVMSRSETYLITPNRHWVKDIFDGAVDGEIIRKSSGISDVLESREGWQKLTGQLQKYTKVATLLPMKDRHFNIVANPARSNLIQKMRRRMPWLKIKDIRPELARLRMYKQPPELAAIKRAITITNETLAEIFKPDWYDHYKSEHAIEAAISSGFRNRQAAGHAFTPIVAAAEHTTQIHHMKNNSPLQSGELLLIDIGAEVRNYSADIARTMCVGKKFSPRQQEIFDAVVEVKSYAQSLLKPGVDFREYEHTVEIYMGKTLQRLGIITKRDRKNIRTYFPHMTSHMLGLDTHDSADYSLPLAENMVLTAEPGIYLPDEKIGIRIEDDLLITKAGCKVLSSDLPIDLGLGYNRA